MRISTALALLLYVFTSTNLFAQENTPQSSGTRIHAVGCAVMSKDSPFVIPYSFDRHPVGENDILIELLYCGICHTDVHYVKSDWKDEHYPMVPGHEMVGRVKQIGQGVTKFKVGDYAGVGCMVNSCRECQFCKKGEEQFCSEPGKCIFTYACPDVFHDNEYTNGGYSSNMVVDEQYAVKIPQNAPLEKVGPLLCAGITTYSPLVFTGVGKGDQVGIAGFGGLGHMAVQYAVAFGAEVTVFDVTESKRQAAMDMGAARYVNVLQPDELKGLDNRFKMILSTIPARYDPRLYMKMLQLDGELVIVGLPSARNMPSIDLGSFVMLGRRKVSGSLIGGIAETQRMMDFSVENNIYPEVEVIPVQKLDEAFEHLLKGTARFRYVLDLKTIPDIAPTDKAQ